MKKIKDGDYYMQLTEVLNVDWKKYSFDIYEKYGANSNEYKNTIVDSLMWLSAYEKFSQEIADKCPVVGITKQQAQNYCKWLSSILEKDLNLKVDVYLPTSDQYLAFAKQQNNGNSIYFRKELFHVKNKKAESYKTLYSGADEITADNKLILFGVNIASMQELPDSNIGFRCVARIRD